MRSHRLQQALHARQRIVSIQPQFPSPEVVELLGYLGYDAVLLDAEHGGLGVHEAQEMVRAADAVSVPSLLRVPCNDAAVILTYLETGVGGVLVPHVKSAAEARAAVAAIRYGPEGRRGAHAGTRAANYGASMTAREYFAQANRETVAAVMIEDAEALAEVEAIAAIPGIDLLVIGPGDLAMSMGFPGQADRPEVQQAVERVLQAALAAGVPAGTAARDGAGSRRLFERGFQFVTLNAAEILMSSARQALDEARQCA